MEPAAFDKHFDAWFRQRFVAEFRAIEPGKATAQVRGGQGDEGWLQWGGPAADAVQSAMRYAAEQRTDEAITALNSAKTLFPAWSDDGSPYHVLADIYLKRADTTKAIAELAQISDRNESAFTENVTLARLRRATGDTRGALTALERTLFITPFDPAIHDSVAVIATALGEYPTAIRSRRALIALRPTDQVEALYQLALLYHASGDAASARREVLRALDLAPNYEKAQDLLLTLRKPEAP
jgi:tetratricopeptide (TPR) repeat protein